MKKVSFIVCIVFCILIVTASVADLELWDCPNCGRKGNTGNFCGGCGHPAPAKEIAVGDIITFGRYPQTASGDDETPIEWLVLEINDGKALLLSKYGLDVKAYNEEWVDITWENCTLREWLNEEFLNEAFSQEEQRAIQKTQVDNSRSQGYSGWDTNGGNNTEDRVYLLSYAEVAKYFAVRYCKEDNGDNVKSRVLPTAYAKARRAYTNSDYKTAEGGAAGYWWLRSPGYYQINAGSVFADGSFFFYFVINSYVCVRPALWVNLESGIF